ncbi:MAG TPA: hypothetical protein VK108_05495 [Pseudogracilibacillus sp.]|nr:hypothetical protein [Pseudogracilibacillus sp.]
MELLELYAFKNQTNQEVRPLQMDEFTQEEFTVKTYEAYQHLANKWVEYSGLYSPDYDEGLYIEHFSLPTIIAKQEKYARKNTAKLDTIEPDALFTYFKEEDAYLFFLVPENKKLPASAYQQIITKKTLQKIFPPLVNIKGQIACVYKGNTLYFTSYYNARQIFNLQPYYEDAVKEEITKLQNTPHFNEEDEIQWSEHLDLILKGDSACQQRLSALETKKTASNKNSSSSSSTSCDELSKRLTKKHHRNEK